MVSGGVFSGTWPKSLSGKDLARGRFWDYREAVSVLNLNTICRALSCPPRSTTFQHRQNSAILPRILFSGESG